MTEQTATQKALERYHAKWSGEEAATTRALYAAAVAHYSPVFGVMLQDHVLRLLGDPSSPILPRAMMTADAKKFIDHMTKGN